MHSAATGDPARTETQATRRHRAMVEAYARRRTVGVAVAVGLAIMGFLMAARALDAERIERQQWGQYR